MELDKMNNIRYEVWSTDHPRFGELEGFIRKEEAFQVLVKLQPDKPIEVVWCDYNYNDSPEDTLLCRNLSVFVKELKLLTGQDL